MWAWMACADPGPGAAVAEPSLAPTEDSAPTETGTMPAADPVGVPLGAELDLQHRVTCSDGVDAAPDVAPLQGALLVGCGSDTYVLPPTAPTWVHLGDAIPTLVGAPSPVADLDGDDQADAALLAATVTILTALDTEPFAVYHPAGLAQAASVGTLRGAPDADVAILTSSAIEVWSGPHPGDHPAGTSLRLELPTGTGWWTGESSLIADQDLDGDGRHDLVVGTPAAERVVVVTELPQADVSLDGFADYTFPLPGLGKVEVGDLDGDGAPDLVVAAVKEVLVVPAMGTVDDVHASVYGGSNDIAVGDLDGDGAADLAVASTRLRAMAGPLAPGSYSAWELQALFGTPDDEPFELSARDLGSSARWLVAQVSVDSPSHSTRGPFELVVLGAP